MFVFNHQFSNSFFFIKKTAWNNFIKTIYCNYLHKLYKIVTFWTNLQHCHRSILACFGCIIKQNKPQRLETKDYKIMKQKKKKKRLWKLVQDRSTTQIELFFNKRQLCDIIASENSKKKRLQKLITLTVGAEEVFSYV